MPSPQARALTVAHRRELALAVQAVTRRVNRLAMSADTVDIDDWWRRASPEVIRIVAQGHDVAAGLARRYLTGHAAMEGVQLAPAAVAVNRQEVATSLQVTGPVAFKTNMRISADPSVARSVMARQLTGSAQRLTLGGDRATIMRTFTEAEEIAGWRRVGGGCAFCLALISRGAVYSKDTADFPSHDHCRCSAEVLYQREPEPREVEVLQEAWAQATAGTSGAESLRAWRDYLAERAVPN